MIEHQLHDINNKLNICMHIVTCLNNKYHDEELVKLKSNLDRVAELVTISFEKIQSRYFVNTELVDIKLFDTYLREIVDKVNTNFLFNLQYQLELPLMQSSKFIMVEKKLLDQIIDNLFDNSRKATATKIIIRTLLKEEKQLILEIVDNGAGEYKLENQYNSLPHGIGTELVKYNVRKMNASILWADRLDSNGKIVRIYFDLVE